MLTGLTVFGLKNDTFASVEKQLIKKLLDRYAYFGKIGRPVMKTDESIDVQFGMSLIQILDVDEKNQVLQTSVWLTYVSNYLTVDICIVQTVCLQILNVMSLFIYTKLCVFIS